MVLKSIIGITILVLSTSANAALIAVTPNTAGDPIATRIHGATAFGEVLWQDIDATCFASDSDHVVNGSASASALAGSCGFGVAGSTLNFSSSSTTLFADGVVSMSVEGSSTPPESSGTAFATSRVDVSFEVDVASNYEISALFVDGGQIGASGLFDSRIQLFEDGLLIQDVSNNPVGLVTLQGILNPGSTYQLISGIEVIGDTGFFPGFTGSGSGNFNISLSIVPIPAAVWLFGSGLIGLIGLARHKART